MSAARTVRHILLAFVVCGVAVKAGCTEPKNPPKCTGTEVWPDPCAGRILDAGAKETSR